MSDRGIGVMLILRGPGGFAGGKASDALVSHIDLFPTICDVLEIGHPDWLQGRSLLPIVTGAAAEVRDAIFAEGTYHAAYEPQRAIRTPRWKLVRRFGDAPSAGAAEHRRQPQQGALAAARIRRARDRAASSSTTSCSIPTRPAT